MPDLVLATKPGGKLFCKYDAAFQRAVCPDGVLNGLTSIALTNGQSDMIISDEGNIIVCGRVIHIPAGTYELGLTAADQFVTLNVTNTEVSFGKASAEEGATWPVLTQDDINLDSGSTYQVIFCKLVDSTIARILPNVTMSGIYYGTGDPDMSNYPYQNGVLYVKVAELDG